MSRFDSVKPKLLMSHQTKDSCLCEPIDVAENHPLWRLISTFGATHS